MTAKKTASAPSELHWSPSTHATTGWGLHYSMWDGEFVRPAHLPADAVRLVPATERPSPAQWAAWFRSCADMADPDELSDDHRKVFRLVAEHFESDHVVRMAGEITGVDQ